MEQHEQGKRPLTPEEQLAQMRAEAQVRAQSEAREEIIARMTAEEKEKLVNASMTKGEKFMNGIKKLFAKLGEGGKSGKSLAGRIAPDEKLERMLGKQTRQMHVKPRKRAKKTRNHESHHATDDMDFGAKIERMLK